MPVLDNHINITAVNQFVFWRPINCSTVSRGCSACTKPSYACVIVCSAHTSSRWSRVKLFLICAHHQNFFMYDRGGPLDIQGGLGRSGDEKLFISWQSDTKIFFSHSRDAKIFLPTFSVTEDIHGARMKIFFSPLLRRNLFISPFLRRNLFISKFLLAPPPLDI